MPPHGLLAKAQSQPRNQLQWKYGGSIPLTEEQQRTLYERVEEMDRVRRALGESLPGTDLSVFGAIAFIQRAVQSRREST